MIEKYEVKENKNASFNDNVVGVSFQHQQFIDFSANSKTLINCDFSYCVFQRVYFKKVKFINCNFTGAKFFDSNLREAEFDTCKFHYSLFKFTIMNSVQVLKNLPEWPNAKVLLLQNHKVNANSLGDVKSSKRFLLEEIDANKEHWRRAIAKNETYYSTKYAGFRNWFIARYNYYKLVIDNIIWGHGETPWKIIVNLLVLLIIVSFFLSFSANSNFVIFITGFYENLKASLKVFLSIPQHLITSNISIAIIILARYLSLGLYIRIMFNKYSWR